MKQNKIPPLPNIKLKKEMNSNLVRDFISAFPDAKLTSVTEEEDA